MFSSDDETEVNSLCEKERWRNAVALRAYRMWQRKGEPEGLSPDGRSWADHFWLRAEAEMLMGRFS
jgi:hypothetical protein